jgi:hypothetical protein
MDRSAWSHLGPWLELRHELPVGRLFCVLRGPTGEKGGARDVAARSALPSPRMRIRVCRSVASDRDPPARPWLHEWQTTPGGMTHHQLPSATPRTYSSLPAGSGVPQYRQLRSASAAQPRCSGPKVDRDRLITSGLPCWRAANPAATINRSSDRPRTGIGGACDIRADSSQGFGACSAATTTPHHPSSRRPSYRPGGHVPGSCFRLPTSITGDACGSRIARRGRNSEVRSGSRPPLQWWKPLSSSHAKHISPTGGND